jgi:hypothetical protein
MKQALRITPALLGLLLLVAPVLAEEVGQVSLSRPIKSGGAILEPGLYTVAIEDMGKQVSAAGETFTISGRQIVLMRGGQTVAAELAVKPSGRHPRTIPSGGSSTRVYTQLLRSDTAPPSGEPSQLFRIVVWHGGEALLGYYELL